MLVLCCTIPTHVYDTEVKVTDLDFCFVLFCFLFSLKFLVKVFREKRDSDELRCAATALISEGFVMQESKQEVAKVISLTEDGREHVKYIRFSII